MEVSILKSPHGSARWQLVVDYMMLRKDVFIEKMNWALLAHDSIEFEQYDTIGYSSYVIAHEAERVLAGCRLIRCDSSVGSAGQQYTYMIKDAYDGRIDLPAEICFEAPPADATYWELTRLAALPGNRKAVLAVMRAARDYLAAHHAVGCLCLSSPIVQRLAQISGFETRPIGPVCGNDDGKFLAFEIPVELQA